MTGLAEAVQGAVGQPATVRIGQVDSAEPTVISAQGVVFNDVGLLGGYVPQPGDSVALLGQCSGTGSDPASWLALGAIQPSSGDVPISRSDFVADQEDTTSTSYVNLATVVGTDFVAPASGRVMLYYRSWLTCGGGSLTYSAPQIAAGGDVGSGDVFLAASDDYALLQPFGSTMSLSDSLLVSFLTPFATYNVVLMVRSSAGASVIASRRGVIVVPAP